MYLKSVINKLKRLRRNSNKNRGFRRQDKINLRDEILADSPKVFKYLRGIQRKLDNKFGQQIIPSPDKIAKEFLTIADITEQDFEAAIPAVAAEAELSVTSPITFVSVADGAARNGETIDLEVAAAAANPTDTVLVAVTGVAGAIVITVTPNDGTNNGAVAVDLTTAELVELVNSGAVAGKNVTLTDASSLIGLQSASGGGAEVLADSGEGDGLQAVFANGADEVPAVSAGLEVQLASGLARSVGLVPNDFVYILDGTLKGQKRKILTVNYSTDVITLEYSDSPLSGAENDVAVELQLSGVN